MNELIDISPDINVREEEYVRLLGYPRGYQLHERSRELADWARDWFNKNGKPWVYSLRTDEIDFTNDILKINNVEFASKKFRDQLSEAGAESVMLVAASAGKELEEESQQLWQEGKPDEYFFLEVYGSAVVEHLVTNTGALFCAWADENNFAVLPHYSPGYPGWNITDQISLLKLIKLKNENVLPGKLEVFETGMLNPKKSLLAVFGITKNINTARKITDLIPCETCSLPRCQYRRTEYKYSLNQIENVSRLQPKKYNSKEKIKPEENKIFKTILDANAKYTISLKALEKWSKERLKIIKLADNSFEAKFKYEGTTCSNLGHALEFEYKIKLSSAAENYKILSLKCAPAVNDKGYTFMCEYINDAESLMKNIKDEKPLLGEPFNNILKWKRDYNPEGCYCKPASREHKWGLVFEVLHFAMVQYEAGRKSIDFNNLEKSEIDKSIFATETLSHEDSH